MKTASSIVFGIWLAIAGQVGVAQSLDQTYIHANEANSEWTVTSNHPKVNGVVRRVDHINLKLTIKHDEIPNLGMEAMTMTFAVADENMVHSVRRGDRIRFSADEINGVLTVIWLEKE